MLLRAWIYTLAGLTFAITGWNLGTLLLVELRLRTLINAPEAIRIPEANTKFMCECFKRYGRYPLDC